MRDLRGLPSQKMEKAMKDILSQCWASQCRRKKKELFLCSLHWQRLSYFTRLEIYQAWSNFRIGKPENIVNDLRIYTIVQLKALKECA